MQCKSCKRIIGNRLLNYFMRILIFSFLLLSTSCNNIIPDQDACIDIFADKDSTHRFINLDATTSYDTVLSTLDCNIKRHETLPKDINIYLYKNNTLIKKEKIKENCSFGWLKDGIYSLQIGEPEKYPCLNIYSIVVPGGRACHLKIVLP